MNHRWAAARCSVPSRSGVFLLEESQARPRMSATKIVKIPPEADRPKSVVGAPGPKSGVSIAIISRRAVNGRNFTTVTVVERRDVEQADNEAFDDQREDEQEDQCRRHARNSSPSAKPSTV